jgi:hypothetical protein
LKKGGTGRVPLVVATNRDTKNPPRHAEQADRATKAFMPLAGELLRLLEPRFVPDQAIVWSEFPGEGLGGTEVVRVGHEVRATDLTASWRPTDESGEMPFKNPLGVHAGVRYQQIIELRGPFRMASGVSIPGALYVNLSPAWADASGDLVFETFKTPTVPLDGFFEVVSRNTIELLPFVQRVMKGISAYNQRGGVPLRVKWAFLKDTEGVSETRRFLVGYKHYETSLRPLLAETLEERISDEFREKVLGVEHDRLTSVAFGSVVHDLVREIGETRDFDLAVSHLQEQFGIESESVGSVILSTKNPDAVEDMAGFILKALKPDRIRTVLDARLGHITDWSKTFAKIASGKSGGQEDVR